MQHSFGVIPGTQLLDPALAVGGDRRDLADAMAFGEKPDRLQVTAATHIAARDIFCLQVRLAEIRSDCNRPVAKALS